MPFVTRLSLPVRTFVGRSRASFAWSDRRALEALDALCAQSPVSFCVCRAFADPACLSPHGGGTAFDLGRELSGADRARLRRAALDSGRFHRVEADALAPDCLHLEALPPRTLRAGDAGADVCRLQALLLRGGADGLALTGTYCERTQRAVLQCERRLGLPADGLAGAQLLRVLPALCRAAEDGTAAPQNSRCRFCQIMVK